MFQYYKPEEKFALEQVSNRIDTLEAANWHGYQGADILEPHLHRGFRNGRRLNDYQWYPLYREVVEGYSTFLDLRHFDNKWDSSIKNSDWMLPAWNAASWEGLKPAYGLAYWNTVEDFRRTTSKVGTIQYTDPDSGIYCQLIDENQINTPEVPMMKILMIRNPRKANYYGLKKFVENLRFILIEKLKYNMAWGLPLTINDSRYPVIGGVDKRFEEHHRMTYKTESGETKEVIISRLAATWAAAGMILMPVPDGEIAPAFISKSYRRKLLKREKLMAQFIKY